jgi:hypothetical protein
VARTQRPMLSVTRPASGRVPWFGFLTFAACLAAAVATAALTRPVAAAEAASDEQWPAPTSSLEFDKKDGSLIIEWSGPIVQGIADYLSGALDKYGSLAHRVVLFLDSAGGKVDEDDRVNVSGWLGSKHRLGPRFDMGGGQTSVQIAVRVHSRLRPG